MGERALQNRVMKLKEIEAQQKALEEQAEKIRQEIKADMETKQVEEMKAGSFVISMEDHLKQPTGREGSESGSSGDLQPVL